VKYHKIPNETVRRLPIYLRGLMLLTQNGNSSISSRKLSEVVNVNAWQIRKDFSYFGEFGTRGIGYNIENLSSEIKKILNLNTSNKTALVGAGNLGSAVLSYSGFAAYGLNITAAFDNDPDKVGKKINGVTIEDVSRLNVLKRRKIDLAIIAIPGPEAQNVADTLVKAGIKGILNFSPCRIGVPKKIKVITIDIATDLARLPYYTASS